MTFHLKTMNFTFFSSAHGTFSKIDHILGHKSSLGKFKKIEIERLLLNHAKTPAFLAPGGEEFNPGPETRPDRSELFCNKGLLKYKGDRESF